MDTSCGTQTITTERLVLRRFEITDVPAVFKNRASDEKVQKMYYEPTYETEEAVRELLEKYIESYEANAFRWAVVLDGECIGMAAYYHVDERNDFAEIEYCIGRAFQRRGYASEATRAIVDYGFEKMGLHKVQICHMAINEPSRRVIEKCGFTYEGTLRDYFFIDGEYIDRLYYSMLRSEWESIRSRIEPFVLT